MLKHRPHIETGKQGEQLAVKFITSKEYILLEQNWRFKNCEVDIIAHKENTLHFFEVKTRHNVQQLLPEQSVTNKKMSKLKEAAQEYLYQNPQWKFLQFNIIAITLKRNADPEIFLIEDVY